MIAHDRELDRLISEMQPPKIIAHALNTSVSTVYDALNLRGMRRGYVTDAERLRIIAERKGLEL